MADMPRFIDDLGADISAQEVPKIQKFIQNLGAKIAADYSPRIAQFSNDLVQDIFSKNSVTIQTFINELIKDLFARYQPELKGNLHTRIVTDGIELESNDLRLDIKERSSGNGITSLDIPVFIRIDVNELFVKLESATVSFQDVQL